MTNLALVLRRWRINADVSLRDFAKLTGISRATLLRIEQGKEFNGQTMMRLLNWLMKDSARPLE